MDYYSGSDGHSLSQALGCAQVASILIKLVAGNMRLVVAIRRRKQARWA